MRRKNDPDKSFYEVIEKMTLPDLEYFIEGLSDEMEVNHEKIDACLSQRKFLLRDMFECTPINVERLHCVANIIKDNAKMLRDKGNQLFAQTSKLWQDGKNKPFTDFYVEISLRINFDDEENSILYLDDDQSGSDYIRMAELLNEYYYDTYNHGNLIMDDTIESGTEEYFQCLDSGDETDTWDAPWFFTQFPELRDLPITWEFHNLLFHSNYALQDIIRMSDIWSEAKVVWQHITGQNVHYE